MSNTAKNQWETEFWSMLKICMWFFRLMTCRTSYSWFLPLTFCQCNNRSLFWRNLTAISILNIVNCFVNISSENWSKNGKQKATWASFLCTELVSNALLSRNVQTQLLTSLVESKLRLLACKKFLCRSQHESLIFSSKRHSEAVHGAALFLENWAEQPDSCSWPGNETLSPLLKKWSRLFPGLSLLGNHAATTLIPGKLLQFSWAPSLVLSAVVYLLRRCWTGTRGRTGTVPALPLQPGHSSAQQSSTSSCQLCCSTSSASFTCWYSTNHLGFGSSGKQTLWVSILGSLNPKVSKHPSYQNNFHLLPINFLINNRGLCISCISIVLLS